MVEIMNIKLIYPDTGAAKFLFYMIAMIVIDVWFQIRRESRE